jgi:uncharacterized protein
MLRAEAEGFVKTNVGIDKEEAIDFIEKAIIKSNNESSEQIALPSKTAIKGFWNLPFLMKHCRKLKKKQIRKRLRSFLKTWDSCYWPHLWAKKEFWP